MNLLSILTKEDYLSIKWHILSAFIGIIFSVVIFLGIDYLAEDSQQSLRIAQADFNNARSRVELIEEEEATIIEYIERYQTLEADGVVQDEDRLLMHEWIAEIRANNNLFPVSLTIPEQSSQTLPYPPNREAGDPVALRSSVIGLDLSLLHEEDLTRLLDGILNSPGLFQTKACSIHQQDNTLKNFIAVSRNFTAECEILWYTFDLDPPAPDPFGF